MKHLLTLFACASLLLSCHKNKNANALTGKWKATETFRTGQIDWSTVSPSAAITLTFNNNNTYTSTPPPVSSMSACSGTYRITNNNTVMMATSCQANPAFEEEAGFTVSGNTLILDYRTTSTGVKTRFVRQ